MIRPPPISTLFPYTTLFRSRDHRDFRRRHASARAALVAAFVGCTVRRAACRKRESKACRETGAQNEIGHWERRVIAAQKESDSIKSSPTRASRPMLNTAYMHDLPKKTQSRSDSARFRAAWSIAPSALPSFKSEEHTSEL